MTSLTLGQFRAASCVGAELHVLLMNAAWVHSELSIRMAKIYRQLEQLPHGLADQPSVQHVRGLYGSYVAQLIETQPPTTASEEAQMEIRRLEGEAGGSRPSAAIRSKCTASCKST